ncbi:chemotaxis protein [uncultured Desulfovibrio sp.]|uniref:Chemotaxis protein n=1 Tax=Candidatus Desulfovibrio intestinavium TaxID=2838534 RepID=A0A9D2HJY4_9BACT|nr:chemotaxis protein [uncultured Desulfovibrio sp.]HJA78116.1 chemotaxis protein [Candidatus Desulfovibrio intestinavium]
MRRIAILLPLLLTLALLPACGPKDIGTGTSEPDGEALGVSSVDSLRQPFTGANPIQRRLYYYNQPNIMMQMQQARLDAYRNYINRYHNRVNPESPEYREVPRQRSPFRQ